jgi:hypothetical protein
VEFIEDCTVSTKLLVVALAAVSLSGCAVGQKFSYRDSRVNVGTVGAAGSAAVAVLDQRAYVRSGKKSESFVGLSRGGYGNPFDVETRSGASMASDMATSIASALEARGLKIQTVTVRPIDGPDGALQTLFRTNSNRLLLFTLHEWKTDTMMRTGLDFDIALDVFDGAGTRLARTQVAGKEVSGASILSAEKDAQAWFAAKVWELLRDDAVSKAMR